MMTTISEAVREWAWIVGQDCPQDAWLLTSYDSWERNPHYRGIAVDHPEEYDDSDSWVDIVDKSR